MSSKFQAYKNTTEKKLLDFTSNNTECYNETFPFDELSESPENVHDTAVGKDQIHYQILKQPPKSSTKCFLQFFNVKLERGQFPVSWTQATVIPIPKPGKDNTYPNKYRLIAITSCICKSREGMINKRLVWFLDILSTIHCGFRNNCSTIDHLVRLETCNQSTCSFCIF